MFAFRPHDTPRLPSFDELMHSIVQPPSHTSQINQNLVPNQATAPRANIHQALWIQQADLQPRILVLQLPQQLSTVPTSNFYTKPTNMLASPLNTNRPEFAGSPSSFSSSTSSSASLGFSGSPTFSPAPPSDVLADTHEDCETLPAKSRRSHTCKTCGRSFTTLGHLARHNRIHTGERNHKCPFPQCNARFARQDNCTQHYRTHLNGKSKRARGNKLK